MNVVIGFDPPFQRTKSRVLWQPMHIRAAHPGVLVDLTDGYGYPEYFQPWSVQQLRGVGGGHAVCDR